MFSRMLLWFTFSLVAFGAEGSGKKMVQNNKQNSEKLEKATFAGGCFWCMEPPFEKLPGVKEVISGFMGGNQPNPSYQQVSGGQSGHLEVVQVHFDPKLVRYDHLLQVFWRNVNPTDSGGQFVDRGEQYGTAIFFHNQDQEKKAKASKAQMAKSQRFKAPIVTPIRKATSFYQAEDYHQDYYKKSPLKYKYYRYRSGRDAYLDKTWGKDREYSPQTKGKGQAINPYSQFSKPSGEKLKKQLTPLQYEVTQEDGTERPFKNEYWDNKAEGIYVDIVSGEPLFSSTHKYKSGTGWPSFYQPIDPLYIVEKEDRKLFRLRTELRSKYGDSHLGHVFKDGPKPTGLRYCINSAALRFIPKANLEKEGYGQYLSLF